MSATAYGAWAPDPRTLDPYASRIIYAPASRSFAMPQRPIGHRFVPETLPNLAISSGSNAPAVLATRRKRASRPKVRTGCSTCKIRRVKCDETKPSCVRCTSTGRKCDGYEFPKQDSSDPPPSPVSPPPKRRAVTFPSLILPPSMTVPFQGTLQEKRIFHRFQVRTVPAFTGGSEARFWHSLVLQVGQEEPVVRNAIIALASLHEDYQIRSGKYDSQLVKDESYREVTLLYGKALRQLNERLDKPTKTNAKLAIICSILFTCFEVLRRNNMAAVVHYQQGMRQLIRQMNLPEADDTAPAQHDGVQFRSIPQDEFDDILRVFARYDIQACTFSKDTAERLSAEVPRVFPTGLTLEQARDHLDNLLICAYQLVKSDLRMYRYWNKADVPVRRQSRRQEAVQTFQDWLKTLEAFFEKSDIKLSSYDAKSLLGLRFQIKVALIMLKMSIDCKPETAYDMFISDFEDIVSRTEILFQSLVLMDAKPLDVESTDFTMELGLIHPLFFVATKCRDWNLRRRAIAQLRKAGKEGVWEGPIMAILAQKIMKLEEQGVTRGTLVPERNRFHDIKKNVDYDARQILFEANKPLDDTYSNWHVHRDVVSF